MLAFFSRNAPALRRPLSEAAAARRFTSSTAGKPIECLAAVAWKPEPDHSKPALSLEKVIVDPPAENEVRVRIDYATLCGTDLQAAAGKDGEAYFPSILGHESAGTVESIGPGVTTVKPGDKIIPTYQAQCFAHDLENDHCPRCRGYREGKTNLCGKIRNFTGSGVMKNGGVRFQTEDGEELKHFMGISCFSQYTVIHEESAGKIRDDSPLEKAPLLACALPTGYGAVFNTAKVEAGSRVAVFGLGTVGLAIVEASKRAGAERIIGIDTNPEKFKRAEAFGATDFVNPQDYEDPIQDVIINMTNGGVDYSFECVGSVDIMRAALECAHIGWGKSVVVGVAGQGQEISTRPFQLVTGRTWTGTAFGGYRSREGVAKLMDEYMDGEFDMDPYITHNVPLRDINEAFRLLRGGESLRTIIWMHDDPPHIGAVPA